jgi:hypothetical protein
MIERAATQLPRFAEITSKRIRRESADFQSEESVAELKRAVKDFIKDWNVRCRSFKWTKKPEEILAKIQKAREGNIMQNV